MFFYLSKWYILLHLNCLVNKNKFASVDRICGIEVVRGKGKRWNQIFENPVQQSGFRKKKKDPKNPRLHQGWEGYADKRHRLI